MHNIKAQQHPVWMEAPPFINFNPMASSRTPLPAHSGMQIPAPWLSHITNRLIIIDEKLDKIDNLEQSVKYLHISLADLEKRVKTIETVKEDQQTASVVNPPKIISEVERLNKMNKDLVEQMSDLKLRNMRDNLLFFGLKEPSDTTNEDCISKIVHFCENELDICNVDEKIDRAHRLGKRDQGSSKVRPIVVKFNNYQTRESICRKAYTLKNNTPFGIGEQYPRDVLEKRKKLIPIAA